MLFLHVTTRIPDRKNEDLFGKKGGTGFPTFMFLDPKGGVLAKQPGALDIARMTTLHEGAKKRRDAFVALQAKAATDEKAKAKLSVWELELTHITLAEFRKRYPDLSKLDEDLRDTVMGVWADATMVEAGAAFRKAMGNDRSKMVEGMKAAATVILPVAKQGAEPGDDRNRMSWFRVLGTGGDALGNAEMLKLAIAGLEDDAESNPRLGDMIEKWKAKLKTLGEGEKEDADDDEDDDDDDDEDEDEEEEEEDDEDEKDDADPM